MSGTIGIYPSTVMAADMPYSYSSLESDITEILNLVAKGLKSDNDLCCISHDASVKVDGFKIMKQRDILQSQEYAFFIGDDRISENIVSSKDRLSDIADCVTGINCGDNKRFLALEESNQRKINGYPSIGEQEIDIFHTSIEPVELPKRYIPIIKGSSSTAYFRTADKWIIEWTASALHHYTNDKKARFQNSSYYFKKGIALPMVKSSKIKATLMNKHVFDQSIVGIFPHDEKYILYLLAFLNSQIANDCIHMINPTANNSANYLKKLPIYIPTQSELSEVNKWVTLIIENKSTDTYQELIDVFFHNKMYKKAA